MTIRSWHQDEVNSVGQRVIRGSFCPNGSSAPTVLYGVGYTVVRTSTGVWTVTLDEGFADFIDIQVSSQLATATLTPALVRVGGISTTNKTFAIVNATRTGTYQVSTTLADVSAASSAYCVAGAAGVINKIYSRLGGAITGADSALTTAISTGGGAFTAITNGGWTVAQSGSALNDIDSATPTAANTVAAGDVLRVTTDGASSTTATLDVNFVIDQYVLADISTSGTANKINFTCTVARNSIPGAGIP